MVMNTRNLLIAALGVALAGLVSVDAYGQSHVKVTKVKPDKKKPAEVAPSAEPDKILYDRAMDDLKHARYTEGRLTLQTLINSYPDSEYLAKAKLAVGDSYFKEGGTSSITQAIAEYKDFITFFPFLDEAAYAQMQVAMAHYRMMEKADRDRSQAEDAEDEFQAFLLKYPHNPLASQAEQRLREVQEVIGEGNYRIARYYYVKQDYRASAARLVELSERYPLYSQSDEALWMLSSIYIRAKQVSRNEDDKNHWADLAAKCYDRIVRDYPLSKFAPQAKSRLKEMGMSVPLPDPNALARMQKQQETDTKHHQFALLKLPLGLIKSNPDVSSAARSGRPNLNPPDDMVSATEVLKPGATGPSFTLAVGGAGGTGGGGAAGEAVQMDSVTSSSETESATGPGVQTITTPDDPGASGVSPAGATPTGSPDPSKAVSPPSETNTPPADATQNGTNPPAAPSASPTDNKQSPDAKKDDKADPKTESTSKKKKGLKKLIPW